MLTEAQLAALEKAKVEKEAQGEVESEGPGYGGGQETFSVGTLTGVGRIYQQTVIDTYSQGAFANLSDRQPSLTAADLLNDQGAPFCEEQEGPLSRIFTDRGTEDCGSPDSPAYEWYLAREHIEHTRTKGKSPQTTGIVERWPKTRRKEFSRIPFRKKIATSLGELQTDLAEWRRYYNDERVHHGRWGFGRTPTQPFLATIPLAKEKVVAAETVGQRLST